MCMNGMCFSIGAKSNDILYNNLVLCLDEGRQTWSWCRCVEHCLVFCPSNFPGFEIPIVESTIQGGRNSMSIGYGSQYPWRPDAGVKNFTKLKNKIPSHANWLNGGGKYYKMTRPSNEKIWCERFRFSLHDQKFIFTDQEPRCAFEFTRNYNQMVLIVWKLTFDRQTKGW